MHYCNIVIIEKTDNIEPAIRRAMGRSEDHGGWWDWYQIGGRYTGLFDGYDPEKDPANIETCHLCSGTGKRTDMEVENGCNRCAGTGKSTKWPTQWKTRSGDVVPIEQVTEKQWDVYRIVTPYGMAYERKRYQPWSEDKFPEQEMPTLEWAKNEYAGHLCVVVDNHS